MGFPSPASDYVESRIDLNKVCNCTGPASRLYIAERYHGKHINSGTMLLIDPAIKPVDGNLLLALINGELDVWRLVTILRRGLESLADKNVFIEFGEALTEGEFMIGSRETYHL